MLESSQRMYYVYILECEGDTLYTGITTDVSRRFQEHQNGTGGRYTRAHRPVRVLYAEKKRSRSSALKREAVIKRLPRSEKLKLLSL